MQGFGGGGSEPLGLMGFIDEGEVLGEEPEGETLLSDDMSDEEDR